MRTAGRVLLFPRPVSALRLLVVIASVIAFASPAVAAPASPPGHADRPSRKPVKGCTWEKVENPSVGLSAWAQRCDFGSRKIDLFLQGKSLFVRYSDGGAPDPVVDVLDLLAGETAEAGVKRIFAAHTPPALAARCVLAPYRNAKAPAGAKLFTFVPNAAFQKELDAKNDPNEVPDAPCGEWGDAPDGIQYFEVHPSSPVRKALFVRVGQDEPLFDEKTLRLIEPSGR